MEHMRPQLRVDADDNDGENDDPNMGEVYPAPSSAPDNGRTNAGQIAGFVTKLLGMVEENSFARVIHWHGENS